MFTKITQWIADYFRIVFLGAIVFGLVLPEYTSFLYGLLTPFVIIVMYLGALDIEYHNLNSLLQYRKGIMLYYIVMMIVLPIVLFYATSWLSIDIGVGVYLLAAAPAGIVAIAFTRMMGGNTLLALCLAVITTISLPFVLPIMTQYVVGSTIQIDTPAMFVDLLLFCILPIIAAYLTQRFVPKVIDVLRPHLDRVSILLVGAMIAGPVAYNADTFLSADISSLLVMVLGLFVLSGVLHVVGRYCFSGTSRENQIAGSLAKGFMNITVMTVIAAKYFSPGVLLIVMLYEFPRDLMLVPFKWLINRKNPVN